MNKFNIGDIIKLNNPNSNYDNNEFKITWVEDRFYTLENDKCSLHGVSEKYLKAVENDDMNDNELSFMPPPPRKTIFLENVSKRKYNIVFRALELACEQLKSANIEISNNDDFEFLNNKIHGTLVGYYLMKAESEVSRKN